jgi:hypothetical protein
MIRQMQVLPTEYVSSDLPSEVLLEIPPTWRTRTRHRFVERDTDGLVVEPPELGALLDAGLFES